MRRQLIAVLLCLIVGCAAVCAYLLMAPHLKPVKVGTFFYVWYDPDSPVSWEYPKIVDTPVLGKYNSCDTKLIRDQLGQMMDLNIDFVVISWREIQNDGGLVDRAAKQVFETASRDDEIDLKFALMIEPLNSTAGNYTGIYNYVFDEFVSPYASIYCNDGKPLLCFFNDGSITDEAVPFDDRFETVLVGQQENVQWVYTDLNCYVEPKRVPYSNQISVSPRYDDSRYRTPSCVVDGNLTEGVYDQEWQKAIDLYKEGKIDTIMITSWNEYVERTAIEPHEDYTANIPDDYLYSQTRNYINQLRQLTK